MISELHLKHFTVFEDISFKFSPGLNILIGANGTGKTHILKLAYALIRTSFEQNKQHGDTIAGWRKSISDDLMNVFLSENLGKLARIQSGQSNANIDARFEYLTEASFAFYFSSVSNNNEVIIQSTPRKLVTDWPIFIPTKELLSLFPGLLGLYKSYKLYMDLTCPDLCERLDFPLMRGERLEAVAEIIEQLNEITGGKISNENGKFYFYPNGNKKQEIDLVAEGFRKIATLTHLLQNGSLTNTTTLFWDDPESNLNPLLIRKLAKIFMLLSARNYQIIIATHSLFLLKELHILNRENETNKVRYFSLSIDKNKYASRMNFADDLETLPDITSLEAELEQTDRFSVALNSHQDDN